MRRVDTEQLNQIRRQDHSVTVINVLSPEKYRERHIPDSENIPVSEPDFAKKVEAAVGGRERPVVVYCAGPACDASEKAASKLEQAGFREVYDYADGMEKWEEAGQRVQASVGMP